MRDPAAKLVTIPETGATYRIRRSTQGSACLGCVAEHNRHLCNQLPLCYWTGFVGVWKEVKHAAH